MIVIDTAFDSAFKAADKEAAGLRAAIDIGSNTVRLLIGRMTGGRVQVLKQAILTTRLGSTRVGDRLSPEGREKTIAALRQFAAMIQEAGVEEPPVAAATSAVREAADGGDFATEVQAKLGWGLSILSGEQEAACSYAGAASVGDFSGAVNAPAVIDVGGGSTELICQQSDGSILGKSVKVGAVRLYNGEVAAEGLRPMLAELLTVLPEEESKTNSKRPFISVGGTITLVAALLENLQEYSREAVSGRRVTVAEIRSLQEQLLPMTPQARLAKYPMLLGREDIITAGLEIYLNLAELLGAEEFIASDAGLLDGLLLKQNKWE